MKRTGKVATEEEIPTVSSVIGEGVDAHRLVRVGAWELTVWVGRGDEEPRIRDLDLGERLGYANPIDIRKLIRRLEDEKKLKDLVVFATVAKTSGGRPGREYWLTEAQALKVVAKSETSIADALLDEVIRVYMLARRGLLPQPGIMTAEGVAMAIEPIVRRVANEENAPLAVRIGEAIRDLAETRRIIDKIHLDQERNRGEVFAVLAALRERNDQIAHGLLAIRDLDVDIHKRIVELSQRDGRITPEQADWLRSEIEVIASYRLNLGWTKKSGSIHSARSGVIAELLDRIDWGSEGERIDNMLAKDWPIAKNFVEHEKRKALRAINKRGKSTRARAAKRQGDLFNKPN